MILSRRIRIDGSDADFIYLSCWSWTGQRMRYEITINKRDGAAKCSCLDFKCRKKHGNILEQVDPLLSESCKHARKAILNLRRAIRGEVDTLVSL